MTAAGLPALPALPPPRRDGRYRLALVCLGNICRSPMAHVVLAERVEAAGLLGRVELLSAGTGDWHVGQPMDRRAAATLVASGYDGSAHRAQQVDRTWFETCDLLLAMDHSNLEDLRALRPVAVEDHERVMLFRDLDPAAPRGEGADRDVPDPYYGGPEGFGRVLRMVERTSDALVARLADLLDPS